VGSLPPLREVAGVAGARGIDIRSHRSRCLRAERLDAVDLVVGFERHHLAAATDECGALPERVFSMLDLVELLEAIEPPPLREPVARAREALVRAHALRTENPKVPRELPDPLGGTARIYRETVTRILDLSVHLAEGLFGAAAVGSQPAAARWNPRPGSPRDRPTHA
jgi:protein-tyrosine-phosphatase